MTLGLAGSSLVCKVGAIADPPSGAGFEERGRQRVSVCTRAPRTPWRVGLSVVSRRFGQGDGQIYTIRGCFEMPAFGPAEQRVHGLGGGSRRQAHVFGL